MVLNKRGVFYEGKEVQNIFTFINKVNISYYYGGRNKRYFHYPMNFYLI